MTEAGAETHVAGAAELRKERVFTVPFVSLMVANGLLRVCTYMLITVVPLYALARGVSPAEAGLTTTFYMAAAVVVRPLSGRLVDTRGRYAVMLFGSLLYCAATGLYVLTLPVWLLLAVRALQGLGFSFNGTAVMTLATDLIPESRMSEGIGYLGVEQTVAQLFAPWLALTLVSGYGYRAAFLVVFALAAANLAVRAPLRRAARHHRPVRPAPAAHPPAVPAPAAAPEPATPGGRARQPWWSRLVDENAVRPAAVMFFVMSGVACVNTFLAAYTTGRGIADSGLFFTASGVTLAVARLSGGRLRRTGTTWVVTTAIAMVAVALLLVAWSPNLTVLLAAGACYGWGMGIAQPGMNALAVMSADTAHRGMANSTYFMALDLSQAVDAAAFGVLAGVTGTGSVFVVAAGVVAASAVAFLALRSHGLLG